MRPPGPSPARIEEHVWDDSPSCNLFSPSALSCFSIFPHSNSSNHLLSGKEGPFVSRRFFTNSNVLHCPLLKVCFI